MREQVLKYIRERRLLRAGDRVCAAVSGGADSVALLRVLLELRSELGIVLGIAHFNHQLRGEASQADEAFVTELASQLEVDFFAGRGDVREFSEREGLSVEAAARQLRYAWLAGLAKEQRFDCVATGHTLDDQAETVLMKFLRGAGTKGLAGIYPELVARAEARLQHKEESAYGTPEGVPLQNEEAAREGVPFQNQEAAREGGPFQNEEAAREGVPFQNQEAAREGVPFQNEEAAREGGPFQSRGMPAENHVLKGHGFSRAAQAPYLGAPESALADGTCSAKNAGPAVRIIRPMLGVTRPQIESYLTSLGQQWREDESNLDHRYRRNRVRHELLPLLERDYNPKLRRVLSEAAEVARGEEEYWEAVTAEEVERRAHPRAGTPRSTAQSSDSENGDLTGTGSKLGDATVENTQSGSATTEGPSLNLSGFAKLPVALQRRVLKRFLRENGIAADFEHVEKLLRCVTEGAESRGGAHAVSRAQSRTKLPGDWLAARQGHHLALTHPSFSAGAFASSADEGSGTSTSPGAIRSARNYSYRLSIPGAVEIPEIGKIIEAVLLPRELAEDAPPGTLLDAALIGPELTIRNWQPGDRFLGAHSGSEAKVKELFSHHKVPAERRSSWPIAVCGEISSDNARRSEHPHNEIRLPPQSAQNPALMGDPGVVWGTREPIVWMSSLYADGRDFPVAREFCWRGGGDAVRIEQRPLSDTAKKTAF